MLVNIDAAKLITFRAFRERNGTLVPLNGEKEVPFPIRRIFYVYDTGEDAVRGEHAHRECHQLLVCLKGSCEILVDDGQQQVRHRLTTPEHGLHIPPTLWARQSYHQNACLVVLANLPFNEADYIRDYEDFLKFRGIPARKSA